MGLMANGPRRGALLFAVASLLAALLPAGAGAVTVDYDFHLILVDNYLAGSGDATRLRGRDNDANGLLEEDQLGMLSAMLAGGAGVSCLNAGMLAAIQAAYTPNYNRVETDLTVSLPVLGTINILDQLAASDTLTADAFHHVLAGLMSAADTSTITFVNRLVDTLVSIYLTAIGQTNYISQVQSQIDFRAENYTTFGNAPPPPDYLGPAGDADADGVTNLDEYYVGGVRKDRETWLADHCIAPPLRIVSVSGGGLKVSGATETFSVVMAGGSGSPAYEWRKGTSSSYVVVAGSASYTIDFVNTTHTGTYYCVITEGAVVRQTPPVRLTVVQTGIYFVQQPSGGSKLSGQTHTFSTMVQGGGPGPYQYTWRKNGVEAGPNSPTWTLGPLSMADAGTYTVSATSNGGGDTITSGNAVLNVTASPFVVTQQPAGGQRYVGQAHQFAVGVSGGSGSFVYEWRKNNVPVGAPSAATYSLNPLTHADAGSYGCVITDTYVPGTPVSTDPAVLQVADPIEITQQPAGATLYVGDNFAISVVAQGGYGTFSYQWQWRGLNLPGKTQPVYSATATLGNNGPYACRVTDGIGTSLTSDEAVLVVVTPVQITGQPSGADRYTGSAHTFSVAAQGGAGALHYAWQKDGVPLGAPDSPALTVGPLAPGDAGSYACLVSDEYRQSVLSAPAVLRVVDPLSFVPQPANPSIYVGGDYTLNAVFTGGMPDFTFQWRKDGNPLPGATADAHAIVSAASDMQGSYDCVVTDAIGTEWVSDPVLLSVWPHVSIAIPPQETFVYTGSACQLSVLAAGGQGSLHYVWQRDGTPLGAPDASILEIPNASAADAGLYSCLVSDEATDAVASAGAALHVADLLTVVSQPAGAMLYLGQSHTFTIEVAGGFPPYIWQWHQNDAPIPGAVAAAYDTGPVDVSAAGVYACVVTDQRGASVSSDGTAVLTISEALHINVQPLGADKYAGESHTFSVTASGGAGARHYDWRKDGASLGGPDSATFPLEALAVTDAGEYRCVVTDSGGMPLTSDAAVLRVAEPLFVTAAPPNADRYVGDDHEFSTSVSGGYPPLRFQWRKDGADLASATDASHLMAGLVPADAGAYACVILDSVRGTITTPDAMLSVSPHVAIALQPSGGDVYVGGARSFSITANGGIGALHYQWRKDGVPFGAPDEPIYGINPVAIADAGVYSCVVSDEGSDEVTSTEALLRVGEPLRIAGQPESLTAYGGDMVSFSVNVSGGIPPLRFQWRKNGVDETGATEATYLKGPVSQVDAGAYSCVVADDAGTAATSDNAALTIWNRISINLQPQGASIYSGGSHVFLVSASGGFGQRRYDWRKNDVSLRVSTDPTYTLAAVTPSDSGDYTCVVTDSGTDRRVSAVAPLAVADHLQITGQPQAAHLAAGQSHVLAVAWNGGLPPLSFQWSKNAVAIGGATSATLTLSPLTLADAGTYMCRVRDARTDDLSTHTAALTVLAITTQPAGAVRRVGEHFTFTMTAAGGSGVLQYDWRLNGNSLHAASAPNLALGPLAPADAGAYTCAVSDDAGAGLISNEAYLQVSDNPILFNGQPAGGNKYAGETQVFSVSVSGGVPPYRYQWQHNAGAGFTDISGATQASLTLSPLALSQAGQYRCMVRDQVDQQASSETAALAVADPLAIQAQPLAADRYVGQNVTFSAGVSGGLGTLQYRWWRDATPLSGSAASITLGAVALADAGSYSCVITDARSSLTTDGKAVLRVGAPLAITQQPAGGDKPAGSSHTFSVRVSGGIAPVRYQWRKNGAEIPGAAASSYVLGTLQPSDQGEYVCAVRDDAGMELLTAPATLTVLLSLTITQQPAGGNIYLGQSKTFLIRTSGGMGAVHYQWRRNGVPVGNDRAYYSLASAAAIDAGTYTCEAADSSTSVMSAAADLSVTPHLNITGEPSGANKYVGASHTFEVKVSGGIAPISYQWYKGANALAGATNAQYAIASITLAHQGLYRCQVRDAGTDSKSTNPNNGALRVGDPLRILTPPQQVFRAVGETIQLSVSTSGGLGTLRYAWLHDGAPVNAGSSFSLGPLTAADAGSYACRVTDDVGTLDSGTLLDLSVGEALVILAQPQSAWMRSGEAAEFRIDARGLGTLRYVWTKEAGKTTVGGNAPVLTIARLALSDAGAYRCTVTDASGASLSSEAALLTVTYQPMYFLQQPQGGTTAAGFPFTFRVEVAGGSGPLSYQWKKDGLRYPDSPDGPIFALLPAEEDDAGAYTCEVSDDIYTAASAKAVLKTDARVPLATPGVLALLAALSAATGAGLLRRAGTRVRDGRGSRAP